MTPEEQAQYDSAVAERDEARSKLKSANDEAKGHRLSSDAYRTQVEDFRSKWQTSTADIETLRAKHTEDLDKVKIDYTGQLTATQKERDEAKASASKRIVDADLKLAARDAGMVDLDGLKLLDREGVKLDDDGNVTNAAELLAAMKEAKPYMFGAVTPPGTSTGTTSSTAKKPNADSSGKKVNAHDLSKEEYDAALKEMSRIRR